MNQPKIVELNGQRLLTTEQLADFYGATEIQIQQNFSNNRDKFTEGKHYFLLKGDALRDFKNRLDNFELVGKRASSLILWTKRGASRHSKMLGTEQAWDMFDELEENYFSKRKQELSMDPRERLKLMYQFQEDTAERVDHIEADVKELKENKALAPGQYNFLGKRISKRVYEMARSLRTGDKNHIKALFKDINSGINAVTGIRTRSQLREKDFDKVLDFVNDWEPSTATKTIIRQGNLFENGGEQ